MSFFLSWQKKIAFVHSSAYFVPENHFLIDLEYFFIGRYKKISARPLCSKFYPAL